MLPVPTGALQISETPTALANADSNTLFFSLVVPTYNEAPNINKIDQQIVIFYDLELNV